MNLNLVTDSAPDQEPVSLLEAKGYLRLDTADDDDQVQGLILAARLEAENEHGRECSQKQWLLTLDSFPRGGSDNGPWPVPFNGRNYTFGCAGNEIHLLDPLITVDSFTWKSSDGTVTPLVENTHYIVDVNKHPGIVCPAPGTQWPSGDLWPSSAVQLKFTAGMTPANAPATIKQGVQLLVSQWYEGRIPFQEVRFVSEIPYHVTSLFRNGKLWAF